MIELLTTIGIIAVLATIAVLVLNPAELLKQGRDERRVTDLEIINQAIALTLSEGSGFFRGDPNTIYISLPDSNTNCSSYNGVIPSLASPWVYACVSASNLKNVDGSGWIPVDFTNLKVSSPLSNLPVDPVNQVMSSGELYYYIYISGWELDANLESKKFEFGGRDDEESTDGGNEDELYEIGTSLVLGPTPESEVYALESCREGVQTGAETNEVYSRWTPVPGSSQNAFVTKLWFWQYDGSLASDETLEMAMYNDGNGASRISEIVQVQGTGAAGWVGAQLITPIQINLGNTYVFGIGPVGAGITYNLPATSLNGCAGYPPASPTYTYFSSTSGGLNATVPGLTFNLGKVGFAGISYQETP